MPRTVTVTFGDGSSHVYNGVPDDATPDAVIARAGQDFAGKQITNIDGGKGAAPKAPEPSPYPFPIVSEGDPAMTAHDVGQMARGAASAVLGTPGDLERLGLKGTTALGLTSPTEKPILPSTEDVGRALFGKEKDERDIGYRQLGGVVGGVGSAAVGAGAAKLAAKGSEVVADATGIGLTRAQSAVGSRAKAGVSQLMSDAQSAKSTQKSLEKITEGRPDATVLDVTKTAPSPEKLAQARASVQSLKTDLANAETALQKATRKLSSVDKYAGEKRSTPIVNIARRELNIAQKKVDDLKLELEKATSEESEITRAHEAISTSEKAIKSAADSADRELLNLNKLSSRLNNATQPGQVAAIGRRVADRLLDAKRITPAQHDDFMRQVTHLVDKARTTKEARKKLSYLLVGGLLEQAISEKSGLSYGIRRLF